MNFCKKCTVVCDLCSSSFRPYQTRPDGLPEGVRFEAEDGSYMHCCTDCMMSEGYTDFIELLKERMVKTDEGTSAEV